MPTAARPPAVFWLILVAYLLLALGYAVVTPTWQSPDEPAHFNYVRHVWETRSLPVLQPGDYPADLLEELKRLKWPADRPVDAIRYESHQPPLFYLLAAPIYGLAQALGASLRGTVIAVRLVSVALGSVGLYVAWRVGRLSLPESSTVVLAAVGLVAFLPMHLAITAAVNNDSLAELTLLLLLWLCLARVVGYVPQRRFIVLGALLVATALLTKTTIYVAAIALPAAAEGIAWWRRHRFGLTPALAVLAGIYLGALLLSGWWFVRNTAVYGSGDYFGWQRHDSIVVGQLTSRDYLAQVGLARGLREGLATVFQSFWGIFGWMGAPYPYEVYWVLYTLAALAAVGLILYAIGRWGWPRPQFWLLGLVIACAVAGVALYNLKFVQFQGRYLFSALTPITLFAALGLREVWARQHERVLLALSTGLVAALAAYGLVVIQRHL